MKLLKYNKKQTAWVDTISTILDKIPETVFYLWPYWLHDGLFLNNIIIEECYSNPSDNMFYISGYPRRFKFKQGDNQYSMLTDTHMQCLWPTREEFEIFCLENGVDSTEVPFLTQEEICAQMLEVIETMNMKDVVDSLRI